MRFGLFEALVKVHMLGHLDGIINDIVVFLSDVELPFF